MVGITIIVNTFIAQNIKTQENYILRIIKFICYVNSMTSYPVGIISRVTLRFENTNYVLGEDKAEGKVVDKHRIK